MQGLDANQFTDAGFVRGIRNVFNAACDCESCRFPYKWQLFQTTQKAGTCNWEAYEAALHDILHPAVYRLHRIYLFLDAARWFKVNYEHADACIAGRPISELSTTDRELLQLDNVGEGASTAGVVHKRVLNEYIKSRVLRYFKQGDLIA